MAGTVEGLRIEAELVLALADARRWRDLITRSAPHAVVAYRDAVVQCFDRVCRPPLLLMDDDQLEWEGDVLPWEKGDAHPWGPITEPKDFPVWGFRGIETVEQLRGVEAEELVIRWFEERDDDVGGSTLPPIERRVIGTVIHDCRWGYVLYGWRGGRPPEDDEEEIAVMRFELFAGEWRFLLGSQPRLEDWGLPGADVPFVR